MLTRACPARPSPPVAVGFDFDFDFDLDSQSATGVPRSAGARRNAACNASCGT
jgi:hypothetical protein